MLRWCMAALWVSLASTGWATETTEDDTTRRSPPRKQVAAAAKAAEEAAIRQAQERALALEARIDALSAELEIQSERHF